MRLSWYQSFQEVVGAPRAKRSAQDGSGDSGKGGGVELKSILSDRETDEKDSFLKSKGKEGETSKQPQKQQNKPPQPVKDEARRTDETSCQGIVRNAAEVYVGHLTESASRSQC